MQAATNTKEVADRTGDAAVQAAKEVAPKIKPAADRFSEQAESAAQRVAEEAPKRIDKASEVRDGICTGGWPRVPLKPGMARVTEGRAAEVWLHSNIRMPHKCLHSVTTTTCC